MDSGGFKAKVMLKVVLVGDFGVGKTTLIRKYCGQPVGNAAPTMGPDIMTKKFEGANENITMQLWDTAGREQFGSVGPSFYRNSQCVVIVYDVTDRSTFSKLDAWHKEVMESMGDT